MEEEIYVVDGYDLFFTDKEELEDFKFENGICNDEVSTYYRYKKGN